MAHLTTCPVKVVEQLVRTTGPERAVGQRRHTRWTGQEQIVIVIVSVSNRTAGACMDALSQTRLVRTTHCERRANDWRRSDKREDERKSLIHSVPRGKYIMFFVSTMIDEGD